MHFNFYQSRYFIPAFLFKILPKSLRKTLSLTADLAIVVSLMLLLIDASFEEIASKNRLFGILFLGLGFRLFFFMLWAFLNDYSLGKHRSIYSLKETAERNAFDILNFEAFYFIYRSKENNLVFNFLNSDFTKTCLLRAGVLIGEFLDFLKNYGKSEDTTLDEIVENALAKALLTKRHFVNLSDICISLFEKDQKFQKFLFDRKIKEAEWLAIVSWTELVFKQTKNNRAWWRKENLLKIPALTRNLAYGLTFELEKYSSDLTRRVGFVRKHSHFFGRKKEISNLETILLKSSQTNALLVGEAGVGKETILLGLAKLISEGKVAPALKNKRLLKFNFSALLANSRGAFEFEKNMYKVLNQAENAANIILVMDDLPEFLEAAKDNFQISLAKILEPYLESFNIQFIAASDKESFIKTKQISSSLMKLFEIIYVEEPDEESLEKIIEDTALHLETRYKIFVIYPAIKEIVNSSKHYLTEGSLPERAIDLLEEVVSQKEAARTGAVKMILAEDVLNAVKQKTGIPLGELKTEEREMFLNLEAKFHERIVNQEEAVSSLSQSLRRSRLQIQNPNRPIGSFLFLGPTGVGKTETAKTLAEIYFGAEEKMIRFDMSEYSREDGVAKLIGSVETETKGILSEVIQEKPYSLLLLDEFEKAHLKVGNLFLQIFEEGFFTTGLGKKINLRNTIIIATSNAGSSLIWETVKQGIDAAGLKQKVIDKIRLEGFFSPELLNRFDAIVVFRPLDKEHLKEIARLLFKNLLKRLEAEHDIFFLLDESVIDYAAEAGYDPVFGARPMRRLIQDKIENLIAKKMISGEIKRGMKIKIEIVKNEPALSILP